MQKFNWLDVANEELVNSIYNALEIPTDSDKEGVRILLAKLFEIFGGFPLLDDSLQDDSFNKIAIGLLDDALREAFANDIVPYQTQGTTLRPCIDSPFKSQIILGDLVHINWCTEEDLSALPELGPSLARRIIDERRCNGAFIGGEDLAKRVTGIGENTATKLLRRLRFSHRPTVVPSPTDVFDLIKVLVDKTGASAEEGLRRILEYALTVLGTRNRNRWYADQLYDYTPDLNKHDCSWISLLRGSEYYYWLSEAIDNAVERIDMAMFHIAMPAEKHPTRLLLDKLIEARKRGVEVRVLLDRDRQEDVYKSTIINQDALDTLKEGGIDARFDTEDKLLHSKFLIIDSDISVIGSHNWSAGSYFCYDDLTTVLNSESFAQELRQRFEKLWTAKEN